MDALKLLTQQHAEAADLFERFEKAGKNARKTKEQLCQKLGDALTIHNTIEEKIFYPATKDARTEELLREAVEEHLAVKRLLADILQTDLGDAQFDAKMKVAQEQFQHHRQEEEKELFPVVRKMMERDELEQLGEEMEQLGNELKQQAAPRDQVLGETDHPAHI
ncbi:hemerythrin domain-containing protein [Anaeromyxobacter diazotrophicus]|uniref:Hemerythrin-like domain-containing protein n=1 Tax=Anaeromyxobacter diazotrophicus TaxID=2590199 RepID=A0A7I9VNY3_9BACT|nr:hemerythrin domain-containing protein [Anaeromyxobacter diazotrophicus]GEJ58111.1 hypothetical protein AMYX_28520 [Anaeromyxobacter diazotrophicus]